ncbi:RNA-guided endonuclease TnpB family protein [Lentzea sp. NPDC051838]|uniref:RNA-guided endonuclease InsQ/TnpB family protein n=1 Tax=Lentzea sp. NPDC051838 TaxID=3154849 RepID=UPI003426E3F9
MSAANISAGPFIPSLQVHETMRIVARTTVKRAYKYRFYPTEEQAAELLRTFGCVRLVYNMALEARTTAWNCDRRRVTYSDMSSMLTAWKKSEELRFLRDVSSVPLQQALRHLHNAFENFFANRARYPRFKSRKKVRASAEYTRSAFRWRSGQLLLAKMTAPLAIVWSRPLPEGSEPSTVTVSRDGAGRWFVSVLVETYVDHYAPVASAVGVDVGLNALVTLSTGEKIANAQHEQRYRERLARAHRALARKQKGSANRQKTRRKIARLCARIADRRRDFLHKLSTRLVRENQAIVIEDLNVRGMLGNPSLARAISDASWSEFRRMVEYKASWYGRDVIVTDRWFPSTKTCSVCGRRVDDMPLKVRMWTCPCGAVHDRDVNAAKNILAAGLAVEACGDGVRPTWRELVRQPSRPPD